MPAHVFVCVRPGPHMHTRATARGVAAAAATTPKLPTLFWPVFGGAHTCLSQPSARRRRFAAARSHARALQSPPCDRALGPPFCFLGLVFRPPPPPRRGARLQNQRARPTLVVVSPVEHCFFDVFLFSLSLSLLTAHNAHIHTRLLARAHTHSCVAHAHTARTRACFFPPAHTWGRQPRPMGRVWRRTCCPHTFFGPLLPLEHKQTLLRPCTVKF